MGITKEQITARNIRTACLKVRDEELQDHRATVSFSSETPVERLGYSEILSHDPECIRQGERQKHMPVLFNHDRDDLVGVVEETWIGDDRRQYATIRFAQTERGQEVESLVRDGILTNVSFAYQIYAWEQPEENVVRAIDWEAFEISLVTIPADAGVGVGRADTGKVAPEPKSDDIARDAQKEERKMTDKSSDDILREERARVAEIDDDAVVRRFQTPGLKVLLSVFRAADDLDPVRNRMPVPLLRGKKNARTQQKGGEDPLCVPPSAVRSAAGGTLFRCISSVCANPLEILENQTQNPVHPDPFPGSSNGCFLFSIIDNSNVFLFLIWIFPIKITFYHIAIFFFS